MSSESHRVLPEVLEDLVLLVCTQENGIYSAIGIHHDWLIHHIECRSLRLDPALPTKCAPDEHILQSVITSTGATGPVSLIPELRDSFPQKTYAHVDLMTMPDGRKELDHPLRIFYDPIALQRQHPDDYNMAIAHLTFGIAITRRFGPVLVLRFLDYRRTRYTDAGSRLDMEILSEFFVTVH
ncbi:hypothetical protein OE88DRAFT_1642574 [Heliocybe sulcata]|uniref:Uncharacterized protein n=1 Tax=Heliocybe sulcata TaxID=5364 RepID=A0A5C3NJX7_9AGAM|nr:hypothetical protein OE88DRAFT_1642574 [Heliocybe sulcata]